MSHVELRIGPDDDGRAMSLASFAHAEGEPGHHYELAKGVVRVVEVPGLPHGKVVRRLRMRLSLHESEHPDRIEYSGGGSDLALRLPELQSERHPDRVLYLTPPPDPESPWSTWVPDVVVEVVSESSVERDHGEKREEYLAAGVREYWILDPLRPAFTVLRRTGDAWREVEVGDTYRPPILPGLELPVSDLLEE